MEKLVVKGTEKYQDSTKKELLNTIALLKKKFGSNFNINICVRLHSSRKDFEHQLGKKTEGWLVGNTNSKNTIDMLDPDAFEKESSHPKSNFIPILRHELAHVFIRASAQGKDIPIWLNEGLAMYFAGQTKRYKKKGLQTGKDFLNSIATQSGWNKHANGEAYRFSALFVNYLINEYSLKNVLNLLRDLNKNYNKKTFGLKFKKILGAFPSEVENKFLESIS